MRGSIVMRSSLCPRKPAPRLTAIESSVRQNPSHFRVCKCHVSHARTLRFEVRRNQMFLAHLSASPTFLFAVLADRRQDSLRVRVTPGKSSLGQTRPQPASSGSAPGARSNTLFAAQSIAATVAQASPGTVPCVADSPGVLAHLRLGACAVGNAAPLGRAPFARADWEGYGRFRPGLRCGARCRRAGLIRTGRRREPYAIAELPT
jgi:hypothetical protein